MLSSRSDCEVVADNGDDEVLLELVEQYQPDAILWDLGWDAELSIESITALNGSESLPPVVALLPDEQDVPMAQAAGINGILSQTSNPDQIVAGLIGVANGLSVFDPDFQMVSSTITSNLPPLDAELTPVSMKSYNFSPKVSPIKPLLIN